MTTGAIITAAGKSSRMGDFKPLLEIGGMTAAERIILNFRDAGIERIALITGKNAELLEESLRRLDVTFLRNELYERTEMFDSIKIGFDFLKSLCDKILLTPVDIPLFTSQTVRALLASEADVALPLYKGKTGHPVMVRGSAAAAMLNYTGEGGLKGAMTSLPLTIARVDTGDIGILRDMDTQEDYRTLLRLYEERFPKPE